MPTRSLIHSPRTDAKRTGKKIISKQATATNEAIVNHFLRESSYFMCMKYTMIREPLHSDNPIKIVSIEQPA